MGDYIWEEIKYISKNPQKICAYAPYIMELIERATKTKYQTDTKHESFLPKVPRHRGEPSPHRYSENEEEIGEEEEEQPQQHSPTAQTGTGLTGPGDRSDRSAQGQHSSRSRTSSPIKKLINLFAGMCRS